jgi:hypothetical protein
MPDHATDAATWMADHPRAMAIFERMALRGGGVENPRRPVNETRPMP